MSMLTLPEWDLALFNGRHSINTLRNWARTGRIQPAPQLVGREYLVDPKAKYVNPNHDRIRRLRMANTMKGSNLVDAMNAAEQDPEMLEILNDGSAAA